MDDSTGGNHFIRMQGTWWKGFFVSHQFKGAGAFGGVFCGRMWGKSEVRFGITVVSYMDDQVGEHFFVHTSEIPPKTNIDIQNDGFWKKPGLDKDLSCCTAKKQLLCWRTFCNKQDPMVDSVDLKYNKNRVDHMHIPYFDMVQPEPLVVKRNLSNSRRSQWHGFRFWVSGLITCSTKCSWLRKGNISQQKNGKMVVSQIFMAIKFASYCLKDAPPPSSKYVSNLSTKGRPRGGGSKTNQILTSPTIRAFFVSATRGWGACLEDHIPVDV